MLTIKSMSTAALSEAKLLESTCQDEGEEDNEEESVPIVVTLNEARSSIDTLRTYPFRMETSGPGRLSNLKLSSILP